MGKISVNTPTVISKPYNSGAAFPTVSLSDSLPFYRTDLHELFHYDLTLGRWVGEAMYEGYGDSGGLNDNQYFRRFNGMGLGPDRGVGFPYDILITEFSANWESPNTNTGSIEIEHGGSTIIHDLPTIGDGPAHADALNVILPANEILSFRRNGVNISNTQGYIKYHRLG